MPAASTTLGRSEAARTCREGDQLLTRSKCWTFADRGTRNIGNSRYELPSAHAVAVVDETVVVRRRCRPRLDSLTALEAAALTGAEAGTRLEVVIEPTGPAWLPVAVFFIRRGHTVSDVAMSGRTIRVALPVAEVGGKLFGG
jgi:hypothetical protein